MEEKNELNNIILDKHSGSNNNKKVILAVATLGVILIIVVMLMNTLTSDGNKNLPQAVLPPVPSVKAAQNAEEEPLFEDVKVIQEESMKNDNLDKIAQKLKEESKQQEIITPVTPTKEVKTVEKAQTVQKKVEQQVQNSSASSYYIQVGSFSKYEPNKKFLKSIEDKGFSYKYHKTSVNSKSLTKVLVGPFATEKEARDALRVIRSSIESGAFLTKM
jgi:DedD protein